MTRVTGTGSGNTESIPANDSYTGTHTHSGSGTGSGTDTPSGSDTGSRTGTGTVVQPARDLHCGRCHTYLRIITKHIHIYIYLYR